MLILPTHINIRTFVWPFEILCSHLWHDSYYRIKIVCGYIGYIINHKTHRLYRSPELRCFFFTINDFERSPNLICTLIHRKKLNDCLWKYICIFVISPLWLVHNCKYFFISHDTLFEQTWMWRPGGDRVKWVPVKPALVKFD